MRLDCNEPAIHERIGETVRSGELGVEVARKAVVGDEDMGFAAQAEAQRGMLPGPAASQ